LREGLATLSMSLTPVLRYAEEPGRGDESGSSAYLRTGVGGSLETAF
jgi:hypothetical protein